MMRHLYLQLVPQGHSNGSKFDNSDAKKALFKFSADTDSVAFNTQVLHKANNDFVSIIDQDQDTSLSYSSKFWSLPALASK